VGMSMPVPMTDVPLVRRVRLLAPLVHGLSDCDPERLPDGRHVAVGQRHDGGRDGRRVVLGRYYGGGGVGRGGDLRRWWADFLLGGVVCDFFVLGVAGGEGDGGRGGRG